MSGAHCEGSLCIHGDDCDCECPGCSLETLLDNLHQWSRRARAEQCMLDVHGADREQVARAAGRLLALAESIERASKSLRGRFA